MRLMVLLGFPVRWRREEIPICNIPQPACSVHRRPLQLHQQLLAQLQLKFDLDRCRTVISSQSSQLWVCCKERNAHVYINIYIYIYIYIRASIFAVLILLVVSPLSFSALRAFMQCPMNALQGLSRLEALALWRLSNA